MADQSQNRPVIRPVQSNSQSDTDSDLVCTNQNLEAEMGRAIQSGTKLLPTSQAYGEMQASYEFFNVALFSGKLPECLFTLQRVPKALGYFCSEKFENKRGIQIDEIALNPRYYWLLSTEEILSVLVHEMVHLWQHHLGKTGRRGYHNRQWADEMIRVGLIPSDTGEPFGKQTGEAMSHYILDGGSFEVACLQLLDTGFQITWIDTDLALEGQASPSRTWGPYQSTGPNSARKKRRTVLNPKLLSNSKDDNANPDKKSKNKSNRLKYSCPGCRKNAWGKPDLNLLCGDCLNAMTEI